jgi:uncharacterized Fe-S cluster protein YjdI
MPATKEYSNGEVTIVWEAKKCIHSANCVGNLPEVFKPNEKPWIQAENSNTDDIIQAVEKCPSGALTYFMNNKKESEMSNESQSMETIVEVLDNGPLMVYGKLKVKQKDGTEKIHAKNAALCRCGASENKPYCDGSHVKIGFKG